MRVPSATYRLQIHAGFTLRDALDLVPYLSTLGISHLYLSPVFEARPGSTHGYDVVDPTRIGTALGGIDALRELAGAAQAHRMGIILDIVPNHMAASELNPWWRDVLENGPDSEYSPFFDIAWSEHNGRQRLALPILGGDADEVIRRGEIRLVEDGDGFEVEYFERRLPVTRGSCTAELAMAARSEDPAQRSGALARILDAQNYQLVHWETVSRHVGYRRFFDITDLAGLRIEDPRVFDAAHALVAELVAGNVVDGLRIDHVDGLRDPVAYLERLRSRIVSDGPVYTVVEKILELGEYLPEWPVEGTTGYDFLNDVSGLFIDPVGMPRLLAQYRRMTGSDQSFEEVVHEKKLLVIDRLFAAELNSLRDRLTAIFHRIDHTPRSAAPPDAESTRTALRLVTAAMPVYRTYVTPGSVSPTDHRHVDTALNDAHRHALDAGDADTTGVLRAIDLIGRVILLEVPHHVLDDAVDFTQRWQQLTGPVMAKGVEDTALYTYTALTSANEVGGGPGQPCVSVGEFHERMRTRMQQTPLTMNTTATHDTKRGEDVRTRIHALTELADEWTSLLRAWVRRSEVYKEEVLDEAGTVDHDEPVPDAKEEILLYQTLVGVWPLEPRPSGDRGEEPSFTQRVQEYMRKAVREGKDHTSWARPDEDYETALDGFIERLLRAPSRPRLRSEINSFADRLAWHGMLGSLAQTLIKCTAPGIPDFYQGTELWSLVLVDPDNRRAVDFPMRAELLARISPVLDAPSADAVAALFDTWRDARIKMYITAQALRFRRAHAQLFEGGEYMPVHVTGTHAERIVAFARKDGDQWCLVVAPRITAPVAPPGSLPVGSVWEDTALDMPDGFPIVWQNVLTREKPASSDIADIFRTVPFALLEPA
jgi:(1->4)-alpha-D-glucan 1-alpha-D-glucosylmutase